MKKHIENIKRQAKEESMKGLYVIIGAVGGLLAAKGLKKLTEDKPSIDAITKYIIPTVLGGGGFLLTTMTENNSKLKYFGYGLEVAGVIEGVKLIPVAKEFLFSGLGDTEIPAATAFYTESESQKVINGVGLSALPIANATLREAARTEMQLPDLEGATNTEDLGYNPAQIDLGYNPSQTDDVDDKLNGII